MSSSTSTNNLQSSSTNNNNMSLSTDLYIYDIPTAERQSLCSILDELNIWTELSTNMGYSKSDLQNLKRAVALGNSPSDELLNMWGEQNHTITELFVLLSRMKEYQAMKAIKSLVEKKYHRLIVDSQPDLSELLRKTESSKKVLNCSTKNMISDSNNQSFVESDESSTNSSSNDDSRATSDKDKSFNIKHVNEYASTIPQINYGELVEATNGWNESNILGKGGFGTVYKGIWKYTGVAIKRIIYNGVTDSDINKIPIQQSLNELKYLNSCRHDNILPLYGYSINGNEPCLVYQLLTGGSLEQRLKAKKDSQLSWSQRLNIARGTARGLQYLHTFREKPLIHGDIKPANILLDPCNQPKIGDFGLVREGPNALNSSMEVSRVYGTKPYLPVEYLGYKSLSTKVDTYSFGVVLLEMVTGLRAYDRRREHSFLAKHILTLCQQEPVFLENLIDKSIPWENDTLEICVNLINLGKVCISEKPDNRPEMSTILYHLESH